MFCVGFVLVLCWFCVGCGTTKLTHFFSKIQKEMIASLFQERTKETKEDNELTGLETSRQLALMINDVELDLKAQLIVKEREKESLYTQLSQCEDNEEKTTLNNKLKDIDEEINEMKRSRIQYAQ
jgi:hypothetical protein